MMEAAAVVVGDGGALEEAVQDLERVSDAEKLLVKDFVDENETLGGSGTLCWAQGARAYGCSFASPPPRVS